MTGEVLAGPHRELRIARYPNGYVAWCECGVGSPPKPTPREAHASLSVHISDPREVPK